MNSMPDNIVSEKSSRPKLKAVNQEGENKDELKTLYNDISALDNFFDQ